MAADGNSFPGWEQQILVLLQAPATAQNVAFLDAWHAHELSAAANNPLNTTQLAPGSSPLPGNSAGVQQYPSPLTGARATVQTLLNGYYPDIVAALRSGQPGSYYLSHGQAINSQLDTWGSRSFASYLAGGGSATTYPGSNVVGAVTGAAGSVSSGVSSATSFLGNLTNPNYILRGLQIVAGGVLVLLGVYLLAKQVGLAPGPAQAAAALPGAAAAERAANAPRRQGDAAISRGEEVTRTSRPRPVDNVDRRRMRANERARERERADADARYGEIPF